MNTYRIVYTNHRGDGQTVECSDFEDAELIAQFLANLHRRDAALEDGYVPRLFQPEKDNG